MKYSNVLNVFLCMFHVWSSEELERDNACGDQDFCIYQCHCGGHCPKGDGLCPPNVQCDKGWFGLRCQYKDLVNALDVNLTTVPERSNIQWLTDGNDRTCNDNIQLKLVKVNWKATLSIPLTWIRIVVSDPASLLNLELGVVKEGESNISKCHNVSWSLRDNMTMDIRCHENIQISALVLGGNLTSICSMYISGGRNVAYRQNATQSSNNSLHNLASASVDGNTDTNFDGNSCSHTKTEASPTWNLSLQSNYVISRLAIFNRGDSNSQRLEGFRVRTFDKDNNVIGFYKNRTMSSQRIYYINLNGSVNLPVNLLSISLEGTNRILALCEVEAYG
ncbi:platelet endothelial aggregation receptor 1, partial [Biomphalaria glabrata]